MHLLKRYTTLCVNDVMLTSLNGLLEMFNVCSFVNTPIDFGNAVNSLSLRSIYKDNVIKERTCLQRRHAHSLRFEIIVRLTFRLLSEQRLGLSFGFGRMRKERKVEWGGQKGFRYSFLYEFNNYIISLGRCIYICKGS